MTNRLWVILILFLSCCASAQQDLSALDKQFTELAFKKKGLNDVIKTDVSGLVLRDFINTVAQEHQLNVSIDSDLDQLVVNSFFDVTVKDVFLFLVQKYDLEVSFMNTIILFKKRKALPPPLVEKIRKLPNIEYNAQNDFLSVKLEKDSLANVAQGIIDRSGKNLVLSPEVRNQTISAYILNRPFDQVLDMMAKSNALQVTKDENGFYYIDRGSPILTPASPDKASKQPKTTKANADVPGGFEIIENENGYVSVRANMADMAELITAVAEKVKANYFYYNKPEGEKVSLNVENVTFDTLLGHIFKGKKYTFKVQDNYYLIGEQVVEGLRSTELIQLENRSIESVLQSLPRVFSEKLEIKEFIELNGLIVSGAKTIVDELRVYVRQIDKVVPMVQIEVIIVQYKKAYDIQTGIKAGLDKTANPTTSGVLFPNPEVNLNASSVNNLIDAFNGLGFIKLGKVTEAFYLNLQALENNSIIKIESTPKIATISGHEARLAIGETSYYFEQTNQLINSGLNNNVLQSGSWKSTDANLSVSIKPYVSTDENVTLTVVVEKSSFLARVGATAPPGKATQKFESLVRVKNGEMVLLGGLDELQKENSGTGTPLLSRIPILKWLFSSRKKSKSNSKLHIFIKPSVIY
ncbi:MULTISPECIES: type II secretion system protein GspD [unclassified Flavobacterium]|uniref:type II secretion system protein GspD n=1 Tax=unclassified Flavobacterium TaxID=196869 RepID=UPI001F129A9E|nr:MULTISPECIES: type II and III secretion system protein [unclassified Flavobacterium]UMY66261.1 type II and III secretion system protein [Flavobacterium sp. HJ-32-4]